MALPLAAVLIPSLIQAGAGIWQLSKANKLSKQQRPVYQTPEAVTRAENMLSQFAYGETPGLAQAREDLLSNYATSMNRAKEVANSPAALLGYQTNITAQQQKALNSLNAQNMQQQQANKRALANFLASTSANYQNREWEYNKMRPFEEAMYTSAMLREGGMQNIFGGLQGGINMGLQTQYMDKLLETIKK